ncbi:plexin A3-like [Corticium candelabrum]|uniref:plexin A3-like n=1 Tax=Corticium candelabrum TaxID=121492 RepID=UPI002E25FCF4|nr:plexin A3-like [Corticium candelabrum]
MLEVTDYFPKVGPSAGGTEVRITGNNLDIGDNVTVILAHQKCDIFTSRKIDEIICVTANYDMSSNASQSLDGLVLRIDNATNSYLIAQNFTYTPNPTIQSIYPGKGLKHGGVALEVIGTWLNSVQNPKILFQNDEWSASGDCKNSKINQSVMTCQQPSVLQSVAQGGHVLLNVTFVMDGVPQSSLQLPDPFFIKPDPVFRFLDDDLTIGTNNYILLKGKNLNVLEQQFYTIYLGRSKVCNIIIFTEDLIECSPVGDVEAGQIFEITVTVGNFSEVLGNVTYVKSGKYNENKFPR